MRGATGVKKPAGNAPTQSWTQIRMALDIAPSTSKSADNDGKPVEQDPTLTPSSLVPSGKVSEFNWKPYSEVFENVELDGMELE